MAYFAKLGLDYKVTTVVAVADEDTSDDNGNEVEQVGIDFLEELTGYPYWVKTSYNHNIRKRYANIGYTYDKQRDAFIPPQPYLSWAFNEETLDWDSPVPYPADVIRIDENGDEIATSPSCKWNEIAKGWDCDYDGHVEIV